MFPFVLLCWTIKLVLVCLLTWCQYFPSLSIGKSWCFVNISLDFVSPKHSQRQHRHSNASQTWGIDLRCRECSSYCLLQRTWVGLTLLFALAVKFQSRERYYFKANKAKNPWLQLFLLLIFNCFFKLSFKWLYVFCFLLLMLFIS